MWYWFEANLKTQLKLKLISVGMASVVMWEMDSTPRLDWAEARKINTD
jgi:hypothetical protein